LFLWQFDGFFRKPLEDFPLSSIFNTAGFVHSACTSASVVSGATRLDSMYSCPGRYSPLQSLLMFRAEFVTRSVVLSPVCTTLNNVHITVGMIMEWHVSISC
jgi:hypothetical protein